SREPGFQVFGHVETAAQRAYQTGQFEILRAEQMSDFAPAARRQPARRQVADRVALHAADAEFGRLGERGAKRPAERFETDADLRGQSHRSDVSYRTYGKQPRPSRPWAGRARRRRQIPGTAAPPCETPR